MNRIAAIILALFLCGCGELNLPNNDGTMEWLMQQNKELLEALYQERDLRAACEMRHQYEDDNKLLED